MKMNPRLKPCSCHAAVLKLQRFFLLIKIKEVLTPCSFTVPPSHCGPNFTALNWNFMFSEIFPIVNENAKLIAINYFFLYIYSFYTLRQQKFTCRILKLQCGDIWAPGTTRFIDRFDTLILKLFSF